MSLMIKKLYSPSPYNEKGFTLIELLLVLIIGGLISSMLFGSINSILKNTQQDKEQAKIKFIQQEINRFLQTNGRFPCPASLVAAVETANFGVEALPNCTVSTAFAGTFVTNTGRTGAGRDGVVRAGAVPTRLLNLPDDYTYDTYGNRYLYAVTARMTDASLYSSDGGSIQILDGNANSVITPMGSAPYILIGRGPNKSGYFDGLSGSAPTDNCSNTQLSLFEFQNCNAGNDAQYRIVPQSTQNGANYFDDTVLYYSGGQSEIPDGAIMYFTGRGTCPDKWTAYNDVSFPQHTNTVVCRKLR